MTFKKVDIYRVYEMWVYKNKKLKINVYIYRMPEDYRNNAYYHFQVANAKDSKYDIRYSSINELRLYPSFEMTEKAVKRWWNENIKD